MIWALLFPAADPARVVETDTFTIETDSVNANEYAELEAVRTRQSEAADRALVSDNEVADVGSLPDDGLEEAPLNLRGVEAIDGQVFLYRVTGSIMVTILPGRETYAGSSRYGVDSSNYAEWDRSYWLQRLY